MRRCICEPHRGVQQLLSDESTAVESNPVAAKYSFCDLKFSNSSRGSTGSRGSANSREYNCAAEPWDGTGRREARNFNPAFVVFSANENIQSHPNWVAHVYKRDVLLQEQQRVVRSY